MSVRLLLRKLRVLTKGLGLNSIRSSLHSLPIPSLAPMMRGCGTLMVVLFMPVCGLSLTEADALRLIFLKEQSIGVVWISPLSVLRNSLLPTRRLCLRIVQVLMKKQPLLLILRLLGTLKVSRLDVSFLVITPI